MIDQNTPSVPPLSPAITLIGKVQTRMRLAALSRTFYRSFLVLGVIFVAGLVVSRVTGYGAEWFNPWMAGIVPLLSLIGGAIFYRRPLRADAARLIDRFSRSKDLFLALSCLEGAAGAYQPLVSRAAESAARSIHSRHVIPWDGWKPARNLLGVTALLVATLLWMPQFDPFGQIQASQQIIQQQKELVQARRATEVRMAELKKDNEAGTTSNETAKAIEALKKLLKAAKPQDSKKNQEALTGVQKGLNQQWKKLDATKMRDLLNQGTIGQQFGEDKGKQKEWTDELREGKTDELKKELQDIRKSIEELAATKDPLKKQELRQKLKKQMRDLQQFADKKVGKKELANALDRAMKQLDQAAKGDKLSPEAMKALAESLDLTEQEMEQLAKDAKDLKNIEDSMQVAQMAQQLNRAGKLDGKKCDRCDSLAEYEELLKELMGEMQPGDGMGERGQGKGSKAPENDALASQFKEENSNSPIKAGKMLMSLKTKGEGEKGEVTLERQNLVRTLKQGVTEAIQKEQIPPGYQDSIQKYFEDLDQPQTETPATETTPSEASPAETKQP